MDLENAASLGKADAGVFEGLDSVTESPDQKFAAEAVKKIEAEAAAKKEVKGETKEEEEEEEEEEVRPEDLNEVYAQILANKKAASSLDAVRFLDDGDDDDNDDDVTEERKDLGFEVHVVDDKGEEIFVPPYSSPEDVARLLNSGSEGGDSVDWNQVNEETYDGYVAIQMANGIGTKDEQMEKMRASRISNRVIFEESEGDADSGGDSDGATLAGNQFELNGAKIEGRERGRLKKMRGRARAVVGWGGSWLRKIWTHRR